PWIPGHLLRTCAIGAALILAGIAIITGKTSRSAAALLSALLFIYFLFLYVPRLIANVHNPAPWTSGAEILALSGIALVLAGAGTGPFTGLARLGGSLFAATLTVFGIQHLQIGRASCR